VAQQAEFAVATAKSYPAKTASPLRRAAGWLDPVGITV